MRETTRCRGCGGWGWTGESGPDSSSGGVNIFGKKPEKEESLEAGEGAVLSWEETGGWLRQVRSQGSGRRCPLEEAPLGLEGT